jgi:hypothetical protein
MDKLSMSLGNKKFSSKASSNKLFRLFKESKFERCYQTHKIVSFKIIH